MSATPETIPAETTATRAPLSAAERRSVSRTTIHRIVTAHPHSLTPRAGGFPGGGVSALNRAPGVRSSRVTGRACGAERSSTQSPNRRTVWVM